MVYKGKFSFLFMCFVHVSFLILLEQYLQRSCITCWPWWPWPRPTDLLTCFSSYWNETWHIGISLSAEFIFDLDLDLLTYLTVFQATDLKIGPYAQFEIQYWILTSSDVDFDQVTYFLVFGATASKFVSCSLFEMHNKSLISADLDFDLVTYFFILGATSLKFGPCAQFENQN